VDISVGNDEALVAYNIIRSELAHHSEQLAEKDEIILLNKIDIVEPDEVKKCEKLFAKKFPKAKIIALSGAGHINIDVLKDALLEVFSARSSVQDMQKAEPQKAEHFYDLTQDDYSEIRPNVTRLPGNIFVVTQPRVEQIVRMTNMQNISAVMRVYDVLEKTNILRRIVGVIEGDLKKTERHLEAGALMKDVESGVVRIANREFSLNKALFGRKWFIERAY